MQPTAPTAPPPSSPFLAAAVNAQMKTQTPKGLTGASTKDLGNGYFHGMLYGETDSRKTVTAANFGGPDKTLIILTRSPEQLRPLEGRNFRYVRAENADAMQFAIQFPEKAAEVAGFPEWKDLPDRVLMIDDMSEGAAFLVEDNETTDEGKERKDGRQIYKAVNSALRELMTSLKRKQMHLIMTALAKVDVSSIANEETIFPDMPKGARGILTADLEYVFFMKKSTQRMLTATSYLQYTKKNEFGKDVVGRREIFAKNKLPEDVALRRPPLLAMEEAMDLRALWEKIRNAGKEKAHVG